MLVLIILFFCAFLDLEISVMQDADEGAVVGKVTFTDSKNFTLYGLEQGKRKRVY